MIITSVRCTAAESTAKNFKEQRYEPPFIHFPPLIQFRIMQKLEYIPAARGRGSTVDTCLTDNRSHSQAHLWAVLTHH